MNRAGADSSATASHRSVLIGLHTRIETQENDVQAVIQGCIEESRFHTREQHLLGSRKDARRAIGTTKRLEESLLIFRANRAGISHDECVSCRTAIVACL